MTEFLLPNNFEQPFIGFSFIFKIYICTRLLSISPYEKAPCFCSASVPVFYMIYSRTDHKCTCNSDKRTDEEQRPD